MVINGHLALVCIIRTNHYGAHNLMTQKKIYLLSKYIRCNFFFEMFNCKETRLKNRIIFSVILLHEQNTEMLVNCPVSITWFMIILNERLMFHIVTSGYSVLFPLSHWLQSRSKQSHQLLYQWRRMKSICCDVLKFKGEIISAKIPETIFCIWKFDEHRRVVRCLCYRSTQPN